MISILRSFLRMPHRHGYISLSMTLRTYSNLPMNFFKFMAIWKAASSWFHVSATCNMRPSSLLMLEPSGMCHGADCENKVDIRENKKSLYETEEYGSLFGPNYRIFMKNNGAFISPWHDIPIMADSTKLVYNMVVEIPRWSSAKMEIATNEAMNPIKQDLKNGVARFVNNIFPFRGYIWNYGAIPQTWEDPNHVDPDTGFKGDNDPIDVIEIGSRPKRSGDVVQIKVLGALALIDQGEMDWKIISIDVNDRMADKIGNIPDVELHMPGLLKATYEWFRNYKIPDGRKPNEFGYNGTFKDGAFARATILHTHHLWTDLIKKGSHALNQPSLNTETFCSGAFSPASQDSWEELITKQEPKGSPMKIPDSAWAWHFVQ